ncbi:MAG: magnesium transporter CorA family protein [Acutalibacteraceae bacterium]|nr:magnesium transporter CorA family protein [Bacillota bacterium]
MVKLYRTEDKVLQEIDEFTDGCWINMVSPSYQEVTEIANRFEIDDADIMAALDDEESSRIELEDGYTLILIDIPSVEVRHDKNRHTTIPLGILITQTAIITVCTAETPILQDFVNKRVKDFSTKKKMRFIYQILGRNISLYQSTLRTIDKMRTEIEERVGEDTTDTDLIDLHELESTLVYFATSLSANSGVLNRLTRYTRLEQYPDDQELLDDLIVENRQAIEMTSIYRDILNGTRELISSIIDSKLNNVMKYLTAITLVMAIPTIISGLYGMNVQSSGMPLADSHYGFALICLLTLIICIVAMAVLKKKRLL